MLCCKCGYNHLTTLEELDCASGKRRKPGGTSVKVQVPSVDPGASVSEVSEPVGTENHENGKTVVSDPLAIFEKSSITSTNVDMPPHSVTPNKSSVTKQERWRAKNADHYRKHRAAYMREYRKR